MMVFFPAAAGLYKSQQVLSFIFHSDSSLLEKEKSEQTQIQFGMLACLARVTLRVVAKRAVCTPKQFMPRHRRTILKLK